MFRGFPMASALFKCDAPHLNRLLATSDCLVILDGFYIDGPHLIYFACHYMAVVFCPITKFAAGHKSSVQSVFYNPSLMSTDARSAPEPCRNRLRMRMACR